MSKTEQLLTTRLHNAQERIQDADEVLSTWNDRITFYSDPSYLTKETVIAQINVLARNLKDAHEEIRKFLETSHA